MSTYFGIDDCLTVVFSTLLSDCLKCYKTRYYHIAISINDAIGNFGNGLILLKNSVIAARAYGSRLLKIFVQRKTSKRTPALRYSKHI